MDDFFWQFTLAYFVNFQRIQYFFHFIMQGLTDQEREFLEKGGFNVTDNSSYMEGYKTEDNSIITPQFENLKSIIMNLKKELNEVKVEKREMGLKLQRMKEKSLEESFMKKRLNVDQILNLVKEMVYGLSSLDSYYRVKDLKDSEMSDKEKALKKIMDLVQPINQENKALKVEIQAQVEEIRFHKEALKAKERQMKQMKNLIKSKDIQNEDINQRQEENQEIIQLEIQKIHQENKELRERLVNEEKLRKKNRILEEDIDILQHKLNRLTQERVQLDQGSPEQQVEILRKEKEFMEREINDLKQQLSYLRENIEDQKMEKERSKQKLNDLIKELVQSQKEQTKVFQERLLEKEQNVKRQLKDQRNELKANLKEIYDKQLEFQDMQIQDLKLENTTLKRSINDKDNTIDDLLVENKKLVGKVDGEMTEIKVNYRLKAEELQRMIIERDNVCNVKNRLDQENKMMREQVGVLKQEFFKLKSEMAEKNSLIKAENIMLKKELNAYEEIEKRVDEGIMEQVEGSDGFLATLQSVPTSRNKRILQAIQLGKEVSKKQQQIRKIEEEKKELENQLYERTKEVESMKNIFQMSQQPGSYLVRQVEEKEQELLQLRKNMHYLQNENQNLKSQLKQISDQYNALVVKADSYRVKRQEVNHLKKMLVNLKVEDLNHPLPFETSKMKKTLPKGPKWVQKIRKR